MANFTEHINEFTSHGTYSYKFDDVGNIILNPSSSVFQEHYVQLRLTNATYDENKIKTFYNTEFVEFIKPVEESQASSSFATQTEVDSIKKENEDLKSQLNDIISQSEQNSSAADIQAIKDIILQLRIELGQGKSELDFESEFPYLPIDLTDTIR